MSRDLSLFLEAILFRTLPRTRFHAFARTRAKPIPALVALAPEGDDGRGRGLRADEAHQQRVANIQAKLDRRKNAKQAAILVVTSGWTQRGALVEVDLDHTAKSTVDREVQNLRRTGVGALSDIMPDTPTTHDSPSAVAQNETEVALRKEAAEKKRMATIQRQKDEASQYIGRKREGPVGGTFEKYSHACVQAQEWRRREQPSISEAQQYALQEFGIKVGRSAIQCELPPKRVGAPTAIPWDDERKLVDILVLLRHSSMNVDLRKEIVMTSWRQRVYQRERVREEISEWCHQ